MKPINYIYGPWFGLKFEKGTEVIFAFLDEQPFKRWMKIEEIYYDEVRNEVRLRIDENPEEHHVRGYNLGTIRKFGIVTREFFDRVGGSQACIELVKAILSANKNEGTPL